MTKLTLVRHSFRVIALACTFGFVLDAAAAEYFVAPNGCDETHDGLSRPKAFAGIQRGLDALTPGDTLTIAPGEYFGPVKRDGLGSPDTETLIRAEIPGTVLLRGDVPLPPFRKLEGHRFTYVAEVDLAAEIQSVIDQDMLTMLRGLPSLPGLDFRPGSFYHVPAENRIYLTTTDFSSASAHRFTASIHNDSGFYLRTPQRVRVEGLAVTGFRGVGIHLDRARKCVVHGCRAYLNHRGININSHGGNLIEHCRAWANASDGISANSQNDDTIRFCRAYLNGGYGLRLYAGAPSVSRIQDSLGWGNHGGDLFMKSGISRHQVERCVGPNRWPFESGGSDIRHCLLELLTRGPRNDFVNNIQLLDVKREHPDVDWQVEFADPDNQDYRLQSGSRFRGAGSDGADLGPFPYQPNIFYLSPEGDDAADGLSTATAWRTLERAGRDRAPGDTLYLLPGVHAGNLRITAGVGKGPLHLRARGLEPVRIAGAVRLEGLTDVQVERLIFGGPVRVSGGDDVQFDRCTFTGAGGLSAQAVERLRITHCAFEADAAVQAKFADCSAVFLSGNRFDSAGATAVHVDHAAAILYSDYNAYRASPAVWRIGDDAVAFEALPEGWERHGRSVADDAAWAVVSGPYGRVAGPYLSDPGMTFRLDGPHVHAVGATSANLEWFASHRMNLRIDWGTTPECLDGQLTNVEQFDTEADYFGSFSLTGLAPETRYYARVVSVEPLDVPRDLTRIEWDDTPVAFTTAAAYADPVTYYVAPRGDDWADGRSPDTPFRTITHAAAQVRPGDTVRIAGGVYHECLTIRATGLPERPITFRSQLGEHVTLDGGVNREMSSLVVAFDKSHLRIDGFYMRNVTMIRGASGAIRWFGGEDVRLTRLLQEDRVNGWPGSLFEVRRVSDLLVRNCTSLGTMGGPSGRSSPRLRIENCAIVRNRIGGLPGAWGARPHLRATVRNTLIADCQANKIHQAVAPLSASATLVLDNNAHYLRPERRIQLDGVMNMAEFEEQVLLDGGMVGNPRFAGLWRSESDRLRSGFTADAVFGIPGEPRFADLFATNPEFVRRNIGLNPDDFRGFEDGPLSVDDLVRLTDALPVPSAGFGMEVRRRLQTLRDQAVAQPSEAARHALREAFAAADTARRARRDATAMLDEARTSAGLPYLGDAAPLHAALTAAIETMAQVLADASADVEALWAAERRLWAAIIEYDTGRQPRVNIAAHGWRFRMDPRDEGRQAGWYAVDFDDGDWRSDVPIEANWQEYMETPYFGAAWYRRTIDVPDIPASGVTVHLNFQGVDEEAWVWVNGVFAGSHELGSAGWEVPFEMDVTEHVKSDQPNQVTVLVRNTTGQGGIWKSVYMSLRDKEI